MIIALERALASSKSFTVLELGASYAPWATAAGVVAKRLGFKNIHCVAVEASSGAISKISEHAALNGMSNDTRVKYEIFHAAISLRQGELFFPLLDTAIDNGGRVAEKKSEKDYRGLNKSWESVQGITFDELVKDIKRIDFLHIDLQGVELGLIQSSAFMEELDSKVATLFLATQSRLIEGEALRRLSGLGWRLLRERPTTFKQNKITSDVDGWTLRDGAQIWINPKFGSLFFDF